nr:hypothetical protein [Yersinia massiliensis]
MRRNIILAIIPAPAGQYCGRCRCARRSAADYHQQCQRHAAGQYSNAQHYLVVAIGIIPGVGDAAGKAIKAAEAALKKGDVTEASKLINKASGEISAQNSANYSKLKDDLRQQNLNNIAKQDPRLEIALKGDGSGKVDFGMGQDHEQKLIDSE